MSIKVSFILPIYNVGKYLHECMESIFRQSLSDYEVILVNDGSKDNSLEICREFERNHDNVYVIDQPNGGVSVARNEGLKAARGEYICFIDPDDYYIEDFAGEFYEICKNEKLDIIRGFYKIYDEDVASFRDESEKKLSYFNEVLTGAQFLEASIREYAIEVVPYLGFFRRQYLLENEILFPKGIAFEEDQIFFLEALLKDECRVMQVPSYFYAYRQRAGSATATPTLKKAKDVGEIVAKELALIDTLTDKNAQKYAKCYTGSSFFQMTCIYGRVPKEQRREIRRICDLKTKTMFVFNAATNHQRMKNALFTFAPWVVDAVYDLRGNNGK